MFRGRSLPRKGGKGGSNRHFTELEGKGLWNRVLISSPINTFLSPNLVAPPPHATHARLHSQKHNSLGRHRFPRFSAVIPLFRIHSTHHLFFPRPLLTSPYVTHSPLQCTSNNIPLHHIILYADIKFPPLYFAACAPSPYPPSYLLPHFASSHSPLCCTHCTRHRARSCYANQLFGPGNRTATVLTYELFDVLCLGRTE